MEKNWPGPSTSLFEKVELSSPSNTLTSELVVVSVPLLVGINPGLVEIPLEQVPSLWYRRDYGKVWFTFRSCLSNQWDWL